MDWRSDVVVLAWKHDIAHKEIAARLHVSGAWLSYVLHGKRDPAGAEEQVRSALNEIIREKEEGGNIL